ncbi:hypothetical protein ACVTMO_21405 [Pseudomonas segetis]
MKFVATIDRDGKAYVLNTAHIVALTARSGRGSDWSEGAWIHLTADSQVKDSIAIGEKDALDLLGILL